MNKKINIHINITTYNRPNELLLLLKDIKNYSKNYNITLNVYNDCSTSNYLEVQKFLSLNRWNLINFQKNNGKKNFWKIINKIFFDTKKINADYYIQLQDDLRLCNNFFDEIIYRWKLIKNPHKISLNPLNDKSRSNTPCWTNVKPRNYGEIDDTAWVDCIYMCKRKFFEELNWRLNPISKSRWEKDPNMSSGVGSQISRRLHEKKYKMYRTHKSLIVHVHSDSKLNSNRLEDDMTTINFIDGELSSVNLAIRDSVTASIASIPSRVKMLKLAVNSLLPQVDFLNVYLNNYSSVPSFLINKKIKVARSQDFGDLGDAGKFYWSNKISGFHLTCDDDIIYPKGYVESIVRAIEASNRSAVFGYHGAILTSPFETYFKSRRRFHFNKFLKDNTSVHILGTGALGYHTSTISVHRENFSIPNMADIWFGILGQRQKIPFVCLRHKGGWIKGIDGSNINSIYQNSKLNKNSVKNTSLASDKEIKKRKWKIFKIQQS